MHMMKRERMSSRHNNGSTSTSNNDNHNSNKDDPVTLSSVMSIAALFAAFGNGAVEC